MKLSLKGLYNKVLPEKIRKKRWFKYIFNAYSITVIVIAVAVLVLGDNSLFVLYRNNKEIRSLSEEIEYYKTEIRKHQELIDKLDNDNFFLETYARETYQMTKDSEDLYVFVEQ